MSEYQRFFKKEYPYDWWFVFDKKQEYKEELEIPFETDYGELVSMSEEQVISLLNEYYMSNFMKENRISGAVGFIDDCIHDCNRSYTLTSMDKEKMIMLLEKIRWYLQD